MFYVFILINILIFMRQGLTCRRSDAICSVIGFILTSAMILLFAELTKMPIWNSFNQKIMDFKLYFALFCFCFGFICIIGKMASLNRVNEQPMKAIKPLNFLLGIILGFNITFLFALHDNKTLLNTHINSISDSLIIDNAVVLFICAIIVLTLILVLTSKLVFRSLRRYQDVVDPVFGTLFAGFGIWIVLAVAPLRLYG